MLFFGPPGLGKTTLAQIVARELGVGFRATSGPVIQRAGDLAALLTNLQPRDVLFIDEIHRLMPAVEEILYPAMEDFQLDLIIGEGPGARSVRIDLPPFTLVGATTRSGLITRPLRERFGIPLRLLFYEPAELALIVGARRPRARLRARRPTAPPRSPAAPAARRASRCGCCAASATSPRCTGWRAVDAAAADAALSRLEVDARGLDGMDRRYLRCIAENYGGGPVGVETMAAALGDQRDVIEEVIEPYLMQEGFVQRTPRGRMLTETAFRHLDLPVPVQPAAASSICSRRSRPSTDERAMTEPMQLPASPCAQPRRLRVYYEDTDAAGIVYHANYLRFAERGAHRDAAQPRLRATATLAPTSGIGFAVRRCTVDYRAPARLDDALTVETAARRDRRRDARPATSEVRRDGADPRRSRHPRRLHRPRRPAARALPSGRCASRAYEAPRLAPPLLASDRPKDAIKGRHQCSRSKPPRFPGPCLIDLSIFDLFLQADIIVKLVMLHPAASPRSGRGRSSSTRRCGCAGCGTPRRAFEESFWSGGSLDDLYDRVGQRPVDPMTRGLRRGDARMAAQRRQGPARHRRHARQPAAAHRAGDERHRRAARWSGSSAS